MRRVDIAIMIMLFIAAAVPRVLDLGTFLTADEKNWMGRSYEFIKAIKDWRFNDTLQTTHPGVTAMWVSGTAIIARVFSSHTPFSFQNLAHFAAAAQLPMALLTSAAVPILYIFLRRLFKPPRLGGVFLPLLASLFVALNPFLIGYSRVVHVDALLASFMILAALAMIIHVQSGYKRGWLITAAVLSGLAILTKAPAIFLLPFMVLVWIVQPAPTPGEESSSTPGEVARQLFARGRKYFEDRGRDLTLWLIIVGLMFVILWPAMLFVPDPKGNALLLKRDLVTAGLTPHHMVEDYTLNSSHYLFTLLTRTSPVTLVFGGLAVLWMLLKSTAFKAQNPNKAQFPNSQSTKNAWLLVAYVFFFVVMMTIVAKKGDRYLMPVFPALDILAAFGVLIIGSLFAKLIRRLANGNWKLPSLVLGGVAILYLAGVTAYYHPYAIAYSNPLFRDNLSQELGWGEGLEQVAQWLNENDPKAVVASWYPEELGAYTSAQVAHINAHEQTKIRYVVLYRNMFGRAPDHYANDFIDEYYTKREPVFVARVAGKEFAWVYEKWVFDRITGELLPGKNVSQEIVVSHDNLAGIDVMIATYSGKATSGELIVSVPGVSTWNIPVSQISDDRWLNLKLPESLDLKNQRLFVEISARGTRPGNAPTVRSNADRLAVRLRYRVASGQEATEEDTLLLKEAE